ncbi:hypothetical protein OpiT1DRAFT_05183 [Opitutaceae bacterium TAV1]|nr:hypothetical protein OpiT1DRAFT_05183 [Opitutaceae bacterium TAV1]
MIRHIASPRLFSFVFCALTATGALLPEAGAASPVRVTDVRVERVTGAPDAVAVILSHEGELSPERLRIFFDTDGPQKGEPSTGGDLMMEGPSFYAYPAGAQGWAWARTGAPVFQATPGKLACIVSAPALAKPFSFFVEVTAPDWSTAQRWPATGMTAVNPARLSVMAPAAAATAADIGPLLAARAASLSALLNGGPDLRAWTPLPGGAGFEAMGTRLQAAGWPATARVQATLFDAAGSKTATLAPARAWRRGDDFAWAGETLGVAWVLVVDTPRAGEVRLTGWLRDDKARCLRIEAGLALPLAGKTWTDDITESRVIAAREPVYGHFAGGRYGPDARQSLYPFAVVEDAGRAFVLETDPAEPRVFTLAADAKFFRAGYDLALSPETKKFPGQATFRCSFYTVERGDEGGFRAALAEFYRRYPDYAERRVPHSGLWMPFSDISKLPGAEDFGFSFFEKVGERGADVDYAKKNGILTLMYTEPWLYWLPFDEGEERTPARAAEKMRRLAALGSGWTRDLAASGLAGATRDAKGEILMKFMDLPWNRGARMEVNTDPDLAPASPDGLNRAAAEWRQISAWLEDPRVDGIYLDSMDAIVQPDHAPAALHATDHPATWTRAGLAPVIAPNVPQYEFTAALGALLRSRGKYLMANFPLVDAPFINRWIDIPGEETDWWSGGQYNSPARARLDYRRALSGRKPFGFLQSTDFRTFAGEPLRRYFETCLLYGFQPSFFSHNAADDPYWHDAKLLERDRPLFRTFIPLVRRVADAGWQPVREARLANPGAATPANQPRLEQFGRSSDGLWHLTLQNPADTRLATALLLPAGLGRTAWLDPQTGLGGWIDGGERLPVALEPQATLVLDLISPERLEDERVFLRGWRSGGDEAATALRALESLARERAAGIRADIAPAGPVIAGEPSAWTLAIRNESSTTLDLRPAGAASGSQSVPLAPGATREVRLTLPAPAGEAAAAARTITWNIVRADGAEASFSRPVLVRSVPPVEATGPGPRLLVREAKAAVPVRLQNHAADTRECLLEWRIAGSSAGPGERRRVSLAAGASETVTLPLPRPSATNANAGAVTLAMKVSSGGRVWWEDECRVVFLDARASLSGGDGVQVTADSTFGGYTTRPLNDGVTDSGALAWNEAAWASGDSPDEHWVRFAFPQPVAVREVVIHWHSEGGVTYTGRSGTVLGEVATGQELVIANWQSKPGERSTRVSFPRQMFKTIRVVQNPGQGASARPGIMWVSEIEVN